MVTVTTLIPTSPSAFANVGGPGQTCFSEQIELNQILPACDTMLIVAMISANDNQTETTTQFTYTLDAIKYCNGPNLLIRYCCDPAYSEVIVNNGVAVGASFSDTNGYCWTVFQETTLPVTGNRIKATDYIDCTACTTANECPVNYSVKSCCEIPQQIFVPVMPGVNVGDSFVDTYGNCWYVETTDSSPITNVVYVDTVYPETSCGSGTCTNANPCPIFYGLQSCCIFGNDALYGYTSSAILGPGYVLGDYFVDQFGICWWIKSQLDNNVFPTLAFITPVTEYTDCNSEPDGCVIINPCPTTLFYTMQNCCTEEIEIWESGDAYQVGNILAVWDSTNTIRECWKILSFSNVGPATITFASINGNYTDCRFCIDNWIGDGGCP